MSVTQFDTENADRDIKTALITVLTNTPDVNNATICQAYVKLGDGAKDLDGTGGNFQLVITIGGQTLQPSPLIIVFGTEIRSSLLSPQFPVPANEEVLIRILSPNVADADVDVTAYLYDATSGDTIAVSGDTTAANNLETMLDGTGGQTFSLGQLNITNAAGHAVDITAIDGAGINIDASGLGGDGIAIVSDSEEGIFIEASGGSGIVIYAVSGHAIQAESIGGNGHGIRAIGFGTGHGISAEAGATGNGIRSTGGATSGAGFYAAAQNNNDAGMQLVKNGTGRDLAATEIGAPVALDGGTASLASMLAKIADDNAGADFNAGTDSLKILSDNIGNVPANTLARNVDSTGGSLTLAKAIEVIVAITGGVSSYNTTTGVWTVRGRDGKTTVFQGTATDEGDRTISNII